MRTGERQRGWRCWWPFALLCVTILLRWNLAEGHPEVSATLPSEAIGCTLAMGAVFTFGRPARSPRPKLSVVMQAGLAGALLLAGPALAFFFPDTVVSASSLVLALSLTPVVVAVVLGVQRSGGISMEWLGPGLAGVAGLLLLLPQPGLRSVGTDVLLVAAPLLTAAGCVILRARGERTSSWIAMAALAGAAVAFSFGEALTFARTRVMPLNGFAVMFDAAIAALSVGSVLRLGPLRYAAQFILLPTLALAEGWIVFRTPLNLRTVGALALLAASVGLLLRARISDEIHVTPTVVP